jgi:lysozyme
VSPVSALLLADLRRDEGLRLKAYPDPKSGAEPWTIGYGHTGPEVRQGLVWSLAQAEGALEADVADVELELAKAAPWWSRLDPVRRDAVSELGFNLGVHELLTGFPDTCSAMRRGAWDVAGEDLRHDQWARDVGPARTNRIVTMLKTGARP